MSIFKYVDPDDGLAYEMSYIVTQSDDEGPEYVEYRIDPAMAGSANLDTSWKRLPPWAMPPEEAIEFWHGLPAKQDHVVVTGLADEDELCDVIGPLSWATARKVAIEIHELAGEQVWAVVKPLITDPETTLDKFKSD